MLGLVLQAILNTKQTRPTIKTAYHDKHSRTIGSFGGQNKRMKFFLLLSFIRKCFLLCDSLPLRHVE